MYVRTDRHPTRTVGTASYLFSGRDKAPSSSSIRELVSVFLGVPTLGGGDGILFDSLRKEDAAKLPESAEIHRLVVRFPDGTPDYSSVDLGLSLLIVVGDLSSPRARVRLADLVRRRRERPLNLVRKPGEVVRILLLDPDGVWAQKAPQIEVSLGWQARGICMS